MKYSLTIIWCIKKIKFLFIQQKNFSSHTTNLFSGYKNGRLFPYLKYSRYQVFGQNGLPYQHHNYQALKYFSIKENIIKIIIPKVLCAIKPSRVCKVQKMLKQILYLLKIFCLYIEQIYSKVLKVAMFYINVVRDSYQLVHVHK